MPRFMTDTPSQSNQVYALRIFYARTLGGVNVAARRVRSDLKSDWLGP